MMSGMNLASLSRLTEVTPISTNVNDALFNVTTGILTFLWYIERYLRLARLEHASAYQLITTNECWREATLTVWGRAWLYLDLTDGDASLGIDDGKIEALVRDADLLSEIARLRTAAGCP